MKLVLRLFFLWFIPFGTNGSDLFAQAVIEGPAQSPDAEIFPPSPGAAGSEPQSNQAPDSRSPDVRDPASPASDATAPHPVPDSSPALTLPTPQIEESPLPSPHVPAPAVAVPSAAEQPPTPEPQTQEPVAQEPTHQQTAPPESAQSLPQTALSQAGPLDEGRALVRKGEYLEAMARLRETVRDYPDLIEARLELGDALAALGDIDSALEEYRRVIQREPQATAGHLKIATLLMAKRHWKEANAVLQTAIAQQPSWPQAHYASGLVRYSLGDTAGAIEAFRRVIELKPDSADAHYQLGLLLKLTKRTRDATVEFATAAVAGHPRAQYFIGAAYASGSGIERQMATAVQWWMAAEDHGVQEAHDALVRLRRAVYKSPDSQEGIKAAQAFAAYREALWKEFPSVSRSNSEDSLGGHLLALNQIGEAIPVLIREASAMDLLAGSQLATIYDKGAEPIVSPFDPRILRYFESAASDGVPQAKLTLARIRALGLGVPADKQSALSLLKGLHGIKVEQLLTDWAAANGTAPSPVDHAQQSGSAP